MGLNMTFLQVVKVLVTHLSFEVLRWLVSDNIDKSPNIELPESLCYPSFNFLSPNLALWWFTLLTIAHRK